MVRLLPLIFVVLLLAAVFGFPHDETIQVAFGERILHAELADEIPEQIRGLSGRDALAEDGAMLFVFHDAVERTFWMKGVRFPIDIIWLRDNTVTGITRNVQPEPDISDDELARYRSPGPVNAALEVVAGTADALHIGKGDVMVY